MEKKRPHYDLKLIQSLVLSGDWFVTRKAQRTAIDDFAFEPEQIKGVVLGLKQQSFYKSMTAYHDHAVWHDVYHVSVGCKEVYIKMSIMQECAAIVSFKEK